MSSIGQRLRLVWVHRGRPVGPVLCGASDRGGAIDNLVIEPHHAAQRAELRAWSEAGRLDVEKAATSFESFRRRRPAAPALEMFSSVIAGSQVGGDWPMLLDGEALDQLPVIEEVAEAAATLDAERRPRLCETGDAHEDAIAAGVLQVFTQLGGSFPFKPEIEQLHIDDQEIFEGQRRDAKERLRAFPALVKAVGSIRYV